MAEKVARVQMPDGFIREARIEVPDYQPGRSTADRIMDETFRPAPRDDSPQEGGGVLDRMGRSMFKSAAAPESAGDMASLATATPQVGEAGVLRSLMDAMKGAPGMVRTVRNALPSKATVGRGFETAANAVDQVMPSKIFNPAKPLTAPTRALGRSLQSSAARQEALRAGQEATSGLDATNAWIESQPTPTEPEVLGRTAYSGATETTAHVPLVEAGGFSRPQPLPSHATGGANLKPNIHPHAGPSRIIQPGPESDWLMRDATGGGAVNPKDAEELVKQYLLNFMRSGTGKP